MPHGYKHRLYLKNNIKHSLKQGFPFYTSLKYFSLLKRLYGAKERHATFLVTSLVFMTSLMSKAFTKLFSSLLTISLNLQ